MLAATHRSERRASPRLPLKQDVLLSFDVWRSMEVMARSLDLSSHGVRVRLPMPMPNAVRSVQVTAYSAGTRTPWGAARVGRLSGDRHEVVLVFPETPRAVARLLAQMGINGRPAPHDAPGTGDAAGAPPAARKAASRRIPFGGLRSPWQIDMPGKIGKYQIVRRLAMGGMAEVFLGALHGEAGSRPVVIKRVHPDLSADDEIARMLIDEARITALLSHENICEVLELGSLPQDGGHFIAMELIDGPNLGRLLRRAGGGLAVDAALYIMSEVLAGLDHAHRCTDVDGTPLNIVHRDISPQNILIRRDGVVKIIDFGVVKARYRLARTCTGMVKGKYQYMSPEQARGRPVDQRTDLYAAGLVLYELLLGQSPFAELSHTEMLRQIPAPRIEPLHRFRGDIPRRLGRIVERALARDPEDRFQTAAELRAALIRQTPRRRRFGRPELAGCLRTLFGLPSKDGAPPAPLLATRSDTVPETATHTPEGSQIRPERSRRQPG